MYRSGLSSRFLDLLIEKGEVKKFVQKKFSILFKFGSRSKRGITFQEVPLGFHKVAFKSYNQFQVGCSLL